MVGFDPYVRAAEIACVTWLVCRFIGALVAALGGSREATTRLKLAALPAVLLTAAYWGASLVPPPTANGRLSPQNLLSALLLMTLAAYGLRGRRRRGVDDAEDEVELDAGATPEPARYAAAVSLSLLPLVATGAAVFITDDADSASEAEAAATAPVWEVMTDDPAAWDDRIRDARRRVFVEPWDASAVRVLGYAHLARGHAEEAARASRIARSLGASAESLMPLEVEALTLEGDCDAAKALYESTLAAYYGRRALRRRAVHHRAAPTAAPVHAALPRDASARSAAGTRPARSQYAHRAGRRWCSG